MLTLASLTLRGSFKANAFSLEVRLTGSCRGSPVSKYLCQGGKL